VKLVKGFTDKVRRSGNRLDINYYCCCCCYYSIEKDFHFTEERTANTNVGLVNLLKRHEKSWMNWRVMSAVHQLDWILMGCDMPHIVVTVKEGFSLHLYS
jgi:hypothetical protein